MIYQPYSPASGSASAPSASGCSCRRGSLAGRFSTLMTIDFMKCRTSPCVRRLCSTWFATHCAAAAAAQCSRVRPRGTGARRGARGRAAAHAAAAGCRCYSTACAVQLAHLKPVPGVERRPSRVYLTARNGDEPLFHDTALLVTPRQLDRRMPEPVAVGVKLRKGRPAHSEAVPRKRREVE